jgi:hypothetical protein
LFKTSSTPGTEVDSDASFAWVRRLLALLPELQQGEESMFPPPNQNSAKSIFMQSTGTVRFKFLATPNSFHERILLPKLAKVPGSQLTGKVPLA